MRGKSTNLTTAMKYEMAGGILGKAMHTVLVERMNEKNAERPPENMRCMRSGCRIEKRKQFPSTVQRLEGAPMLGGKRTPRPKSSRHRDQCRRWPAGKGWATS